MSVYRISYKDGAKFMRPILSREEYLNLRGSEVQKRTLEAVRGGDVEQKKRLVQINYSCLPNDDGTLKGATRMSTSVGMDIDHIEAEEMEAVKERILEKKDELGLLMLERSARGQGYHVVFRRRVELTQVENLRWASKLLEVEFDKGAKDITRVFFTTTGSEEDLIFLDDGIFEVAEAKANTNCSMESRAQIGHAESAENAEKANTNCSMKARADGFLNTDGTDKTDVFLNTNGSNNTNGSMESRKDCTEGSMESRAEGSNDTNSVPSAEKRSLRSKSDKNLQENPSKSSYPSEYKGIAYTEIIAKYWELFNDGKLPQKGDRDTLTYQLACDLRHICGRNAEWLDEVIPCYDGFPLEEKRQKIHNAL